MSSEGFEWGDVHRKVFGFVDEVEDSDSGVGIGLITSELCLEGEPGFREVVLLEDAVFDLVEQGFLSLSGAGFVRVESYPGFYNK